MRASGTLHGAGHGRMWPHVAAWRGAGPHEGGGMRACGSGLGARMMLRCRRGSSSVETHAAASQHLAVLLLIRRRHAPCWSSGHQVPPDCEGILLPGRGRRKGCAPQQHAQARNGRNGLQGPCARLTPRADGEARAPQRPSGRAPCRTRHCPPGACRGRQRRRLDIRRQIQRYAAVNLSIRFVTGGG